MTTPTSNGAKVGAGAAVLLLAGVLVSRWEGVRYQVYADPGTRGAPWSVCYGHTGPEVKPGQTYSKAECDALLQKDLGQAQAILRRCIARPMPERVEAAYVSLVFNVGSGPVCIAGKTPRERLRAGDWAGACKALDLYKRAAGRVMRGLVLRRADERAMCEGRA